MQPRVIVACGAFEPNTRLVESLGLRRFRTSPVEATAWPPRCREVIGMMRGEDISWQFSRTRTLGIGISIHYSFNGEDHGLVGRMYGRPSSEDRGWQERQSGHETYRTGHC